MMDVPVSVTVVDRNQVQHDFAKGGSYAIVSFEGGVVVRVYKEADLQGLLLATFINPVSIWNNYVGEVECK